MGTPLLSRRGGDRIQEEVVGRRLAASLMPIIPFEAARDFSQRMFGIVRIDAGVARGFWPVLAHRPRSASLPVTTSVIDGK
jgi:hypothetical protein